MIITWQSAYVLVSGLIWLRSAFSDKWKEASNKKTNEEIVDMKKIAKITSLLLIVAFTLTVIPGKSAHAAKSPLLVDYLTEHEEYKWADFLDINEDGTDELIVTESQFGSGLLYLTLCALSEDESTINTYRFSTYSAFICFAPEYHALVADAGTVNSYQIVLMTYDHGEMYIETIGEYDTDDGREYVDILTRWEPDTTDGRQGKSFQEDFQYISEQYFNDCWDYFIDGLPHLMLKERDLLLRDITANDEVQEMVSAGGQHSALLLPSGKVVTVGGNSDGQRNTEYWDGVVELSCGILNTVGVREDRTVLATGNNQFGQCDVSSWTHIIHADTQHYHTLGIREDKTVVAVGLNKHGECDVESWTDITNVAAGQYHSVGLKSDGSAVATGDNQFHQCDVTKWANLSAIDAGYSHTIGLLNNGRVVAAGNNDRGQCNVSGWTAVKQVSAGGEHTVALREDGTVLATGNNDFGQCDVSGWKNIVQVSAGYYHTLGLQSDGTVVAAGWSEKGQCNTDKLNGAAF